MTVKVMLQIYPVIPAADEAEREALRPIGRNSERYQQTIQQCHDVVRACDELGLWGVACIEHHFHSEGYEVGPSPGLLNAYWAAITSRVRVGQLGYVMSAQHPIRVAEEVAILDHLTRGRCFVGFARGYQDRWTDIIGQHLGTRSTYGDDAANRDVFNEQVELVLRAWTEESIEHNSPLWQIPHPYDAGIEWWMAEATARLGAPGEIGADGRVHRVSVVPAPYTKPHPPIFQASSGTDATIRYCGSKGFIPTYFTNVERADEYGPMYLEAARAAGHDFVLGQNQATVRWLQIGETHAKAVEALELYDAEIQKNFYNHLDLAAHRMRERLAAERGVPPPPAPQRAEPAPLDTPVKDFVPRLEASQQHVAGTVEEVRDRLVRQWKVLPAEYIVLIMHLAQQPKESVIWNLEQFMRHVKPALDELTPYASEDQPSVTAAR